MSLTVFKKSRLSAVTEQILIFIAYKVAEKSAKLAATRLRQFFVYLHISSKNTDIANTKSETSESKPIDQYH